MDNAQRAHVKFIRLTYLIGEQECGKFVELTKGYNNLLAICKRNAISYKYITDNPDVLDCIKLELETYIKDQSVHLAKEDTCGEKYKEQLLYTVEFIREHSENICYNLEQHALRQLFIMYEREKELHYISETYRHIFYDPKDVVSSLKEMNLHKHPSTYIYKKW